MKKTILLAALVISASIGSQGATVAPATQKLGVLNFALADTYQHYVYLNGAYATNTAVGTACAMEVCGSATKYVTGTDKIDNVRIIKSIGAAMGVSFTAKAQLVIFNYDNNSSIPAYPPYLACEVSETANNTFNGPEDLSSMIALSSDSTVEGSASAVEGSASAYANGMEAFWPNENQINWVDYSEPTNPSDYAAWAWPKATVHISDPSNGDPLLKCVDVSSFFSFEEAYCYFCWDTVDRVTSGTAAGTGTTATSTGEPCIGTSTTTTSCKFKASGTTKWYFTIKFNNVVAENEYLQLAYDGGILPYLLGANSDTAMAAANQLTFVVTGDVTYPWAYKTVDGLAGIWGTMTMSQANGYARNPFCGVLTGSVKVTESDNAKVTVCF